MAKAFALIAAALCFLAVATANDYQSLDGKDRSNMLCVEGEVYCDQCRVLFPVDVGVINSIGEADVELTCRDRENGTVTATVPTKTDDGGYYTIYVDKGIHDNDICEVKVQSSPLADCNQIAPEIASVRVSLAKNTGIISNSRYANPIGFVRNVAHPACAAKLDQLGFIPEGDF